MGQFDLHVSAQEIDATTIAELDAVGYRRDDFANSRRCNRAAYHASLHAADQPEASALWLTSEQIVKHATTFIGSLESEQTLERTTLASRDASGLEQLDQLPAARLIHCPIGTEKECDIHISIAILPQTEKALQLMSTANLPSFDKPTQSFASRVYTVTCQRLSDGVRIYHLLRQTLDSIPSTSGKMKLEKTVCQFRCPPDAPVLPLLNIEQARAWITALSQLQEQARISR